MRSALSDTAIPIERLTVSPYRIPTDFPEADGLSMQLLMRLSADLVALEALASTDEAVPDRKASAALFHHSAQKGCAQMQRCLAALHHLAQWRSGGGETHSPSTNREVCRGNTQG